MNPHARKPTFPRLPDGDDTHDDGYEGDSEDDSGKGKWARAAADPDARVSIPDNVSPEGPTIEAATTAVPYTVAPCTAGLATAAPTAAPFTEAPTKTALKAAAYTTGAPIEL